MRKVLLKASLSIFLLLILAAARVVAQDTFTLDRALSQLPWEWEYRTYRDKWTLVFQCDHKMLLDREPADYTLIPGAIRIQDGDGTTDYPYTFEGNDPTLTLPDGSSRTYRKTDPGEAEQLVHGAYFTSGSSSSEREALSFDGNHSFVLDSPTSGQSNGDPHAGMIEKKGVYRVEGEIVCSPRPCIRRARCGSSHSAECNIDL